MMTVNDVCRRTGVSIRTLQYYDTIGLLPPTAHTATGYRLYDDTAIERLQQILLFKELEFSLKDIKAIMDAPDFDWHQALSQQIELLCMKKEHLERLIDFARQIKLSGVNQMDFSVFDKTKMDRYAQQAKEKWGQTLEYKAFEEKSKDRSSEDQELVWQHLMLIFVAFGKLQAQGPEAPDVQLQVKKLQDYISEHFYPCSSEILKGLGQMYASGGAFTENIDHAAGKGTAAFVAKAVAYYCR